MRTRAAEYSRLCCALHLKIHRGCGYPARLDMPRPLLQSEVAVSTHAASKWLVGQRMIAWDVEQQRWGPTTLGNAVMASSMDPDVALEYIQVCFTSQSAWWLHNRGHRTLCMHLTCT